MEKDNEKKSIGFNLACEQFRHSIIDLINNSNLPVAPVYYIIQNLYEEIEKTYYAVINGESMNNPIEFGNDDNIDNSEEEEENSD